MIDAAVIVCTKRDYWQVRACIASVRHWEPDLPVFIMVDEARGTVDLSEAERYFGARRFPASRAAFGSPLSKLDIIFQPQRQRYLVLDSDTILIGPAVRELRGYDSDFVVPRQAASEETVRAVYFDLAGIAQLDDAFEYPGYVFNTGQLVVTSGILTPADFGDELRWADRPTLAHPEVFKLHDQGLLNYVLAKQQRAGRITVSGYEFKVNPMLERVSVTVRQLAERSEACPPQIVHWMGEPGVSSRELPQGELFRFYEQEYFRRVGKPLLRTVYEAGRRGRRLLSSPVPPWLKRKLRDVKQRRG